MFRRAGEQKLEDPTNVERYVAIATGAFMQGKLYQTLQKDDVRAEACYRKAAYELDMPDAYWHLSLILPHGSTEWVTCVQKAASALHPEACLALSNLDVSQREARGTKIKWIENYGMGREWAEVAAAAGHPPAMMAVARMHHEVNQIQDGFGWLDRAEAAKDERVAADAVKMKTEWKEQDNYHL